jgi:hypothetical protein
MSIRYVNVVVFMTRSLTYHNSRHIKKKKDTPRKMDLQKTKFTNIYQMDKLWWEMCNRECGECLMDVKSEGADTEKV